MWTGVQTDTGIGTISRKDSNRNPNGRPTSGWSMFDESVSTDSYYRPDVLFGTEYSLSSYKTEYYSGSTEFGTTVYRPDTNRQATKETTQTSDEFGDSDDDADRRRQGTPTDNRTVSTPVHSNSSICEDAIFAIDQRIDELFRTDRNHIRYPTGHGPSILSDNSSDFNDGSVHSDDGNPSDSSSSEVDDLFTGASDSDGGYGHNRVRKRDTEIYQHIDNPPAEHPDVIREFADILVTIDWPGDYVYMSD
ncbi:Hypothetical protein CINCED_3A023945, partial [Cinara cedri]